jgi:transposase-like protein
MANGKLTQSKADVQRLLNDKDAMRKMVENAIQEIVAEEFEAHMGRKPYERGNGRSTHRNSFRVLNPAKRHDIQWYFSPGHPDHLL